MALEVQIEHGTLVTGLAESGVGMAWTMEAPSDEKLSTAHRLQSTCSTRVTRMPAITTSPVH